MRHLIWAVALIIGGCATAHVTPLMPAGKPTTQTPVVLPALPAAGTFDVLGAIEVGGGTNRDQMVKSAQAKAAAIGADAIVITRDRQTADGMLGLPWQCDLYAVAIRRK